MIPRRWIAVLAGAVATMAFGVDAPLKPSVPPPVGVLEISVTNAIDGVDPDVDGIAGHVAARHAPVVDEVEFLLEVVGDGADGVGRQSRGPELIEDRGHDLSVAALRIARIAGAR